MDSQQEQPKQSPLDELEEYLTTQIKYTERDRDAYLQHAQRCQEKVSGLQRSLKDLQRLRTLNF